MSSLNVISRETDATLSGIAARCEAVHQVGHLAELTSLLERLVYHQETLDLIGHSTRGHSYLRIGFTVIDMLDRRIDHLCHELGAKRVLQRIGIRRLRLLGCETAVTVAGQRTMAALARTLDIEVWGSTKPLMKGHYMRTGFNPRFDHLLIEAQSLPIPRSRIGSTRSASWRSAPPAFSNP